MAIRGIGATTRALLAVTLAYLVALQPAWAQQVEVQQRPGAGKLNIIVIEGDGATNNVRQRVAREPIVQVEDENKKPVAGAAVTFILPNQGAGGSFANGARSLTVLTDNQGRAVARGLQTNTQPGNWTMRVSASFGGATASTGIAITNAAIAGAAVGAGISTKLLVLLIVGGAAAAGGTVAATRNGGSSNTSPTPPATTVSPGSPSVGPPR
ncbi:MAG: hypothetical protein SFV54_05510 [Bryobacteraceae bacterium]|nr:hypothetical protein [Bryobacteraceae bacterium]